METEPFAVLREHKILHFFVHAYLVPNLTYFKTVLLTFLCVIFIFRFENFDFKLTLANMLNYFKSLCAQTKTL